MFGIFVFLLTGHSGNFRPARRLLNYGQPVPLRSVADFDVQPSGNLHLTASVRNARSDCTSCRLKVFRRPYLSHPNASH